MYEPVVLKKKQPRTIARTPAGKAFIVTTLIKILIPTAIFYVLGESTINRKRFIAELEEGYRNRKKTLYDEYKETQEFWNAPIYRNVVSHVLTKESQKLLNTDNSNSPSEQVKANN